MNTLHIFGCSYSELFHLSGYQPYKDYYKFRNNNFPPTWSEILAKKLHLSLNNYAFGGSGNDEIFQRVCSNSHKFRKGDVVIIGWSYMNRFRWALPGSDKWTPCSAHCDESMLIDRKVCEEVSISRTNKLHYKQLEDYQNIIESLSKAVDFELFFWSGDCDIIYEKPIESRLHPKYICSKYIGQQQTIFNEILERGGQRIREETNGLIDDLHFGETAHSMMSELYYEHIIEMRKNIVKLL
jgi:hypothetical protein